MWGGLTPAQRKEELEELAQQLMVEEGAHSRAPRFVRCQASTCRFRSPHTIALHPRVFMLCMRSC
jgi:hypothetical protein